MNGQSSTTSPAEKITGPQNENSKSSGTLLEPFRVLDLTDEKGYYCGRIFSALGADVIKVEEPSGDPGRWIGPFIGGIPKLERSISWWASNTGKRSITLDIKTNEGQESFVELVKSADFVIESFTPGYLADLGLDYSSLSKINPAIVLTSITPFGQSGPYSQYKSSDLVSMAVGGAMNLTGDPDRSPLRFYKGQSFQIAGVHATACSLVASHYRNNSGLGQHVDVSIQECITSMLPTVTSTWEFERKTNKRSGSRRLRHPIRCTWHCQDGYVNWLILGGQISEKENHALAQWLSDEGISDRMLQVDWSTFALDKSTRSEVEIWGPLIERLFLKYTLHELEQKAKKRGVRIMGLRTVREAVDGENFTSRGFWSEINHPDFKSGFKFPGRLFQTTNAVNPVRPRVPLLGEHNENIWRDDRDVPAWKLSYQKKPANISSGQTSKPALEGVRIMELGWAWTGPFSTRYLAQFGAEVVKIESMKRPDVLRYTSPYKDDIAGVERGAFFAYANSGKLSFAVDLTSSRGLELAKELIRQTDIVVENFRPGVIDRLGLSFDVLKKIKPDIIMASISILGRGGASDEFGGFGPAGGAASGYFDLTGWPDRDPTGLEGGLGPGDFILAPFAVSGILAALDRRCRTGQGEYIDCNQSEILANLMAIPYLQYVATGLEPTRLGNRDPDAAPHGAFRCKGDDMWCAIAVFEEKEWHKLIKTMGRPQWALDARFATIELRKRHEDELEKLVEEWTLGHIAEELMTLLQCAGVRAGVVESPDYLFENDPQLKARKYFIAVNHSVVGTIRYPSPPARLSVTPHEVRPAPLLGEHNEYICCRVLGKSDREFVGLVADGVLG